MPLVELVAQIKTFAPKILDEAPDGPDIDQRVADKLILTEIGKALDDIETGSLDPKAT
jgi:hypothetical protein